MFSHGCADAASAPLLVYSADRPCEEIRRELKAHVQAESPTPKTQHTFKSISWETSWVREMKRWHWTGDCHIELNLITLVKGFVFWYWDRDTPRISRQEDG